MTVERRSAVAALTAAGVLWGTTVPLSKVALEWLPPGWLTFARFGLAAAVLLPVAGSRIRAACSPAVLVSGALGYGGSVIVQNVGITATSVSHAALLIGAAPVLVAIIAALWQRTIARPVAWAGFAISLAGIALITGSSAGGATMRGDGLVLSSLVLSATFTVAQARLLRGRDPLAVTAVQFLGAALAVLPVAVTTESIPAAPGGPGMLLATIGLAAAGTLAPFTLFAYGQSLVSPEVAGAFINIEPLVGAMAGVVFFANPAGPEQLAGGAAVLIGIAASSLPALGSGRSTDARLPADPPLTRGSGLGRLVKSAGVPDFAAQEGGPAAMADSNGPDLEIGVVLEAFLDSSLDQVLSWLRAAAPEITAIEVGAGGYAPHPHCDVADLLLRTQARSEWLATVAGHGFRLDALNAWGNPLHPDADLARKHDADLRNAIRLAVLLGADRVVAMAGCPSAVQGDQAPHFGAGGWLPYLEGVYERQWEQQVAPYWAELAAFAAAENPDLRVCLELHPGTAVFNVETFGRVAALGPAIDANLDPSHFFWMGMDGHRVAAALGERVGHAHGKDTVFHADNLALNGLLDARWPQPPEQMPWNFAVPGRGHDLAWWTELMRTIAGSHARVVSIEHEDPFVPATAGVPEAARLLRAAIDAAR